MTYPQGPDNAQLPPYYQPTPPKKHHRLRWTIIGIAVVGVAIGISAGASGGSHKNTTSNTDQLSNSDAVKNVSIASCAADPSTHWPAAQIQVTNPTSKNSTYLITIAFESKDGKTQYDTGLATVDSLGHGQTATDTAQGLKTVHGPFTCRITDVQRMAS